MSMRVALHDGDGAGTGFPNLALMKISAYHKGRGDSVEWFSALNKYGRTYSSKVFTFTPRDPYLPADAVLGGTGYGLFGELPEEIECCAPDYSLYPGFPHALGFITRGCIRACPWCIVPAKEGGIRFSRSAGDITGDRRSAVFMDNNFLAWGGHYDELRAIIRAGTAVDFNQGLDARLVDVVNAPLLAKVRWIKYARFSCDTIGMLGYVANAVRELRTHGYHGDMLCHVLVRGIGEAHEVCESLRKMGVSPFAQAYIDYSGEDRRTREQRDFCRWVNHKAIFKSVRWKDYKSNRKGSRDGRQKGEGAADGLADGGAAGLPEEALLQV